MITEKEIITGALELPLASRAAIIEHLLASLMETEREEMDTLWAKEAEDRIDAYDRGEIVSVPGEKLIQNMLDEDN